MPSKPVLVIYILRKIIDIIFVFYLKKYTNSFFKSKLANKLVNKLKSFRSGLI